MNHRSAVENALFASRAIDELVLGQCVVECEFYSIVCSPLFVVTNASGKQHWVLDLKYVNQFYLQLTINSSTRVWSLFPPCLTVTMFSQLLT